MGCAAGLLYLDGSNLSLEKIKTERADALSILMVRVSRFELEATHASHGCQGGLKYKRPRVLSCTKNKETKTANTVLVSLVRVSRFELEAS